MVSYRRLHIIENLNVECPNLDDYDEDQKNKILKTIEDNKDDNAVHAIESSWLSKQLQFVPVGDRQKILKDIMKDYAIKRAKAKHETRSR